MAKFNVFRKGGQVSATVYGSPTHRNHILNTVGNVSPFYEEVSENGEPTHMIVYQPIKVELEKLPAAYLLRLQDLRELRKMFI